MLSGIYCYKDLENDREIVYVGKDTHIYKNRRHKEYPNEILQIKINMEE